MSPPHAPSRSPPSATLATCYDASPPPRLLFPIHIAPGEVATTARRPATRRRQRRTDDEAAEGWRTGPGAGPRCDASPPPPWRLFHGTAQRRRPRRARHLEGRGARVRPTATQSRRWTERASDLAWTMRSPTIGGAADRGGTHRGVPAWLRRRGAHGNLTGPKAEGKEYSYAAPASSPSSLNPSTQALPYIGTMIRGRCYYSWVMTLHLNIYPQCIWTLL